MVKSTGTPEYINIPLDKPSKRTLRYDNGGSAGVNAIGSMTIGGIGAMAIYAGLTGNIPSAISLAVGALGVAGACYYLKDVDFG